jgi:lysophospholipid acyltransferase (LPLAT)-like uncharacterized protein
MLKLMLPLFATLLAKTLRFRWVGGPLPERCVVVFWHGKMFAGWYAMRDRKPIALVSKSKDGTYLSSVLSSWGYKLARGSSKKQGMEALDAAIEQIKARNAKILVITPDGPRGPRHEFKRGAFIAAQELGLPLYMLSIQYHPPMVFQKSWDKFELPNPFSRVTITAQAIDISSLPVSTNDQYVWLETLSLSFKG